MGVPVPNPANVVVGIGYMWTAPVGTAAPADPLTLVAGTTFPTDWGTPWLYSGATDSGLTITETPSTTDVTIEEQLAPALIVPNKVDYSIAGTLAEDTLANMVIAYGRGTIVITAPGTTQVGKSTLTLSESVNTLAVGCEFINKLGFLRRIFIPTAMVAAATATPIRRASKRVYPVTFRATCPMSSITITDYTATHT